MDVFLLPQHLGSHKPPLEDLSLISGGRMLLYRELILAGDNHDVNCTAHNNMLCSRIY